MADRPIERVDGILDRLIVPSFTRIGPALRRRMFDWTEPDVAGKRIAVTGPTSGLGLATATALAEGGAEVLLLARNRAKAERVATDLGDAAAIVELDLADLDSVRAAGAALAEFDRLDALVHNGGGLHHERTVTGDGIELTLATHVVAPFALTRLALDALRRSGDGRVITVTSGGMYSERLRLDDLQNERDYRGTVAYARAKRAQVDLTAEWARREPPETGVSFHAMHPGWAATPGVSESLPGFSRVVGPLLRTPAEGADTIVWLCGADAGEIGSGDLWLDRRRRPVSYRPNTVTSPTDVTRLWDHVDRILKEN